MEINEVTGQIVRASLRIHSRLGPGLLESVYERILARDLERCGLVVERQKGVEFEFEGMHFEEGFRADLIVERAVLVEVKAVTELAPVHTRQVLTYLKLLDYRVGLLINFGALHLKDGLRRIVNGPVPSLSPTVPPV